MFNMPHVNMSFAESTFHTTVDVLLPYHRHYVTRMSTQSAYIITMTVMLLTQALYAT